MEIRRGVGVVKSFQEKNSRWRGRRFWDCGGKWKLGKSRIFGMYRTPQRSYTAANLEAWFERFSQDWEEWFDRQSLEKGRQLYREETVRSTELLEGSAIVHFKRGKDAVYVIVDWKEERPEFRQSDPSNGEGLAVAGMYALEEMVAEEVPAVPPEESAAPQPQGTGKSKDLEEAEEKERVPRNGAGGGQNGSANGRSRRRLKIRVEARTDGLWITAERVGKTGVFRVKDLELGEREDYIRFAALAHKREYRPGGRVGSYRLEDPQQIADFLGNPLAEWRRHFVVEMDPNAASWARALQPLEAELKVTAAGSSARFEWSFRAGEERLSPEQISGVLHSPGAIQYLPGLGLYQLEEASAERVHDWKQLLGRSESGGEYPRWLLLRFRPESGIHLDLDKGMAFWRAMIAEGEELSSAGGTFLRPYQRQGVGWLRHYLRAGCHPLLADEMGLGKTLQVLEYLKADHILGKRPVLVVCPASVLPVWQAEIERFYPDIRVCMVGGDDELDQLDTDVGLISYTQLRRKKAELKTAEFDTVVLDEAQVIKNPDTKVSHACAAIRSRQRIALTGTPLENHPLDVWSIFRFLMPGLLGTRAQFEKEVKNCGGFVEGLRRDLRPFILRRTKNAVLRELPPKLENRLVCPLSPAQRSLYRNLVEGSKTEFSGGLSDILGGKQRMHVFALLTRLRQVCCDPGLLPGQVCDWRQSGKLEVLSCRMEEILASGGKVVVFSQFVSLLERIEILMAELFPEAPVEKLTGSTVRRERPVERFREAMGGAVFLVSLRAGGTGLNLQCADYVFLMDPWWNPSVESQAIDRVHRMGQSKTVFVYRMVARGTVEDRIQALKEEKGELFDQLFSDLAVPRALLEHVQDLQEFIQLEGPEK